MPVAHRGLHHLSNGIPENSLAAFKAAAEAGYPIELDVHLLKDGGVAVFHDRNLKRLAGVEGKISELNQSDLSTYKILGTSQTIPSLRDVLALVQGKVPLLIETKTEHLDGRLDQAVMQVLDGYKGAYALQSFNPYSVQWMRKNAPHAKRGLISGTLDARPDLKFYKRVALRHLLFVPIVLPHFIAMEQVCLAEPAVRLARLAKIPVLAWTVKSEVEMEAALARADNVIFENFAPK